MITILQNVGSRSARRLAEGLALALRTPVGRGSAASRKDSTGPRYIVNWGVAATPANWRDGGKTYSNTPASVNNCRDKILTFRRLQEAHVDALEFTTDRNTAVAWQGDGKKVIVRRTTTSHSGHGIVVVREGEAIPQAPLYTKYFRKDAEYRLHVLNGRVILTQQKRRDREADQDADQSIIRVHDNGWVFTINGLDCDAMGYRPALEQLAIAAIHAVGAGHGAVDILVRHAAGRTRPAPSLVVCEINSAPALEADSTREAYVNAFAALIRERGIVREVNANARRAPRAAAGPQRRRR